MEHIALTFQDRVATIELNRPETLNALNVQTLTELLAALRQVEESDATIVVLKGRGRGFSSGGDIKSMLSLESEHAFQEVMDTIKQLVLALYCLPKLTISYIHGPAAGLGLSLALVADYIIATKEAKLAMNFIGIGLIPDGGGHFFLQRRIGEVKAKQVIWEGEVIGADEAHTLGLVDEIGDDRALEAKIHEWLAKPMKAMIATKELYVRLHEQQLIETLQIETKNQALMRQTKDHEEGVRAFLEKRPPRFTGE